MVLTDTAEQSSTKLQSSAALAHERKKA